MSLVTLATAFAPATTSNLAAGFDVLGHALRAIGDRVTVRRTAEPGVRIRAITGCPEPLPTDAESNTATAGLLELVRERELGFGLEVEIEKGIPLGSGMGGSAASAAGAMVAANALLPEPLPLPALLRYALVGEAVASGAAHADNLAPCLWGGLVLVRSAEAQDVVRLPVPPGLRCVVVHPALRLDTKAARAALPRELSLQAHVQQSANLGALVAGCCSGDLELIGRSLSDVVAEPHRAPLIPGFAAARGGALEAGALGCSISGAGPSVFAWCAGDDCAEAVRKAVIAAFSGEGVESRGWVSPVDAPGARVVETR